MARKIFVNLPIKDMERSKAFFSALGFFFQTFTKKPVSDRKSTEVLICLSCDSREEVDALVRKAVAAGARTPNAPQDHGFMYGHGFEDIDGHGWELMWMDMAAAPPAPARDC
jgi:predicted lactoylglutathione lyase